MIKSIETQRISNSLKLAKFVLGSLIPTKTVKLGGVNYYFCCDVSGSMSWDLPEMRKQIKNKIADIVKEGDTLTIIWFSGRGEAGILKEFIQVNDLKDLQSIHASIDRFLKPVGMTGFLDPLVLTEQCIDRAPNKNLNSLVFLSDGYNNSARWSDIMAQLTKMNSKINSATFVEYGYYADSRALQEMAEEVGGEKVFAKDFHAYEIEFDKVFKQKTTPKISIDLTLIQPYLYYMYLFTYDQVNRSITFYNAGKKESELLIPESVEFLLGFSDVAIPNSTETDLSEEMYAAVYALADKLKYDKAEDFLYGTGDVNLIDMFSTSYGKEKLNAFKDVVKESLFEPSKRYVLGKDMSFKLNPNKFCLMDLFDTLKVGSFFHPLHPDFQYERTGAKREAEGEKASLVFEKDGDASFGSPFTEIVVSSERANISLRVKYTGNVILPPNEFNLDKVKSFIYRNYTFVKDGVIHTNLLPISTNRLTFQALQNQGLIDTNETWVPGKVFTLNLHKLPIINRSMTINPSAKHLARLEWDSIQTGLRFKYIRTLNDNLNPKDNYATAAKWSPEIAEWLKGLGITDYNGFNPGGKAAPTGDVYMAPTLNVKFLKIGTIASNAKFLEKATVKDKIEKGTYDEAVDGKEPKMNLMEELMYAEYQDINAELDGLEGDALKAKVKEIFTETNIHRTFLLTEISKVVFGITLSRTWFKEFSSFEENELDITLDKRPLKAKFEFVEEEMAL